MRWKLLNETNGFQNRFLPEHLSNLISRDAALRTRAASRRARTLSWHWKVLGSREMRSVYIGRIWMPRRKATGWATGCEGFTSRMRASRQDAQVLVAGTSWAMNQKQVRRSPRSLAVTCNLSDGIPQAAISRPCIGRFELVRRMRQRSKVIAYRVRGWFWRARTPGSAGPSASVRGL